MSTYTGNATRDPASINLIDDSSAPNASNFNPPQESLADSVAYLRAGQIGSDGLNWHSLGLWPTTESNTSSTNLTMTTPAFWNSVFGFWSVTFQDTTSHYAFEFASANGITWNVQWFQTLSSGNTTFGYGVSPISGKTITIGHETTGSGWVVTFDYAGGTQTIHTGGSWTAPASGHWWSGTGVISSVFLPSTETFVMWKGGTNTAPELFTTDGSASQPATSTGSWVPPSGWLTSDNAWYNDGTNIVLFSTATTTAGQQLAHSSDGNTWAFVALPSLIDSGAFVIGAGYDSFTQLYWFASTDGSTTTRLWTSLTGISSWTNVATINRKIYGFAVNQRELLIWISYGNNALTPAVLYRPARSVDGGVTWQVGSLTTQTQPGTNFKLSSGGNNAPGAYSFVYNNTLEFAGTLQMGRGNTIVL